MKIQRFKLLIAAIILTAVAVTGYAQVNRDELQDLPPVVFINYEGPHARLDTREEIRQIGVALGRLISDSETGVAPTLAGLTAEQRRTYSYTFDVGASNRYFVIHSVSGQEENKIDADILGLGVDAGVDHIRNLRVIIQGYLQDAYNYSASDAALLAEYITIYNAVYRGDWDYFGNRYKAQVMSNLTRDRVGLSIRYDEWPGKTLITIPLGIGGLSSVDTSTITDQRVIEEMRKEDDQGIPQRREMVNLVERESERAEQQAQTQREAIREEEEQIARERRRILEDQQEDQEEGRERRRILEDQQEESVTTEDVRRALDDLVRREDELDQRREVAQALQDLAERKSDEAQQMREEIARDQQSAIAQETGGIYGVTIEKTNPVVMGKIVRINPANGSEIRKSPLDTVHVRTITFMGGRIIAIAGENRGQGAVRIIEITPTTLEMARQGYDDIKSGSLLWVNGNDLYAIIIDLEKNQCYLGRFNTNLELQAKSNVRVHPESSVTIQQGRILSQREDGSALTLNSTDLIEVK
jgi:HD-GYP domain-containing protein (c-di-GMP phosphodiesterase class II)